MTWEELELGWQMALARHGMLIVQIQFQLGSYLNENNELVSIGQNMICVDQADKPVIYGNSLAHAEINAIIQLKLKEHPNIRSYTLYSTTEPCILCVGAIVMGNIRHCKFAARDRDAGAT